MATREFITLNTEKLTGKVLDWVVATLEQSKNFRLELLNGAPFLRDHSTSSAGGGYWPRYSTNWAHGGPIIERIEGFELKNWLESTQTNRWEAHIHNYEGNWIAFGPTPLVAAMRCYVLSKLGAEVAVPGDLPARLGKDHV